MQSLKKEAQSDLERAETELRNAKRKMKDGNSPSTSTKPPSAKKAKSSAKKSPDEASTVDEGQDSEGDSLLGGEENEADSSGRKAGSASGLSSSATCQLCGNDEDGDDDLFEGDKFAGRAAKAPPSAQQETPKKAAAVQPGDGHGISDELQEMLEEVVSKHFPRDVESCLG